METVKTMLPGWRRMVFAIFCFCFCAAQLPSQTQVLINQVFDQSGKALSLKELSNRKDLMVLLFLGADCPLSQKAITEATEDLLKSGGKDRVGLFGVLVARDDAEDINRLKEEFKANFPFYLDKDNQVASNLGVKVVPTAVLMDPQGKILYQGRINDRVEELGKRSMARRHDLREALADALQGKPVRVAKTETVGCPVETRKVTPHAKGKVEYFRDIQPILYRSCGACHQKDGVAPFALTDYDDAALWIETAIGLVENKVMPPGQVVSDFAFADESSVPTPKEVALLRQWVSEGMPKGVAPRTPLALPPTDPGVQDLGKPDFVLKPEGQMTIAATGDDLYRFFVYKLNLDQDLKVKTVRLVPGNRKVVHHAIVWFSDSGLQKRISEDKELGDWDLLPGDKGPGYGQGPMLLKYLKVDPKYKSTKFEMIGGYAPGNGCYKVPKGYAISIPKKTDLVVQVHYHRTGKVETDFSSVELYLEKGAIDPTKEYRATNINDEKFFVMPPNQRKRTQTAWLVEEDCLISAFSPHGHYLTLSQTLTLERPDGKMETLVHVPNYDLNWQRMYTFREPIRAQKGSKIHVSSLMDNTSANPNNPNKPPKAVFMGENTWDEMVFPFMALIIDKDSKWDLGKQLNSLYRTGSITMALKDVFGPDKSHRKSPRRNTIGGQP
jgi:hypothetical protein